MKKILLAAALAASCGLASAQGYAGALIGMSQFSVDCPVASCDKSDTAFKIYGGYEVADGIAVEVGYTDFGTLGVGTTGKIEASVLSVVGAFRFPLSADLTGVGRLGLGYVSANSDVGPSEDATNLYAGLGLEYAASKDFKIVGTFDLADNGDVYLFGIGAQIGF